MSRFKSTDRQIKVVTDLRRRLKMLDGFIARLYEMVKCETNPNDEYDVATIGYENSNTILNSFGITTRRFGKGRQYKFYLNKWQANKLEIWRISTFSNINKDVKMVKAA